MPTLSVGVTNKKADEGVGRGPGGPPNMADEAGVTLLEMMIVVTLLALAMGLVYPSVNNGLDGMRLRSAADGIAGFVNSALTRAERRQQVIELWISPGENALTARSPDLNFLRRLEIPAPAQIASIRPESMGNADQPRRFLFYPGGAVPRIGIEIVNPSGRRRIVSVDPVTGAAKIEEEIK